MTWDDKDLFLNMAFLFRSFSIRKRPGRLKRCLWRLLLKRTVFQNEMLWPLSRRFNWLHQNVQRQLHQRGRRWLQTRILIVSTCSHENIFLVLKWSPFLFFHPTNCESIQLRKWSRASLPSPRLTRHARMARRNLRRLNQLGRLSVLKNHHEKPPVWHHMGKPRKSLLLSPSPVYVGVSLLLVSIYVRFFYCVQSEQTATHRCRSIQGANVGTRAWPCLWSKACGRNLLSGKPFWTPWPLQKSRGGGMISRFLVVAWAFGKIVVLNFLKFCYMYCSMMILDTSQDVGSDSSTLFWLGITYFNWISIERFIHYIIFSKVRQKTACLGYVDLCRYTQCLPSCLQHLARP